MYSPPILMFSLSYFPLVRPNSQNAFHAQFSAQRNEFENLSLGDLPAEYQPVGEYKGTMGDSEDWYTSLFDVQEVASQIEKEKTQPMKLTKHIVRKSKVVLSAQGGGLRVVNESYISYSETAVSPEELLLREMEEEQADTNFNFASQLKGRAFQARAMPHLRLDLPKQPFPEPIRHRDKHWGATSQRGILDHAGDCSWLEMPPLPMGAYDPSRLALPRLVWCAP